MKKALSAAATLAVLLAAVLAVHAQARSAAEAAALKSLDEYMAAFNSRDAKAWAQTLHYPHVRIASGQVRVWQTPEEYVRDFDFSAFAERESWHHSAWSKREIIQTSADKVHVAVSFTRFDAQNQPVSSYESLYVVTEKDGHWGTQARSSFAP